MLVAVGGELEWESRIPAHGMSDILFGDSTVPASRAEPNLLGSSKMDHEDNNFSSPL
jgi:hypothetical protein